MLSAVTVAGRRVPLDPSQTLGRGGEADVYRLPPALGGGAGVPLALKLYKTADHPDLVGQHDQQDAAGQRLRVAQEKLPALMRLASGSLAHVTGVVLPSALAEAPAGVRVAGLPATEGRVVGYTMPLIAPAEPFLRLSDPALRRAPGADGVALAERVTRALAALSDSVASLHRAHIQIGDFNDLNVLVPDGTPGGSAWLIDADSYQFDKWRCVTYTTRFLDPRLSQQDTFAPARPHDDESDWYAFNVLICEGLLLLHPYAGVYRPAPGSGLPAATQDQRPLRRVSIFADGVKWPKVATPISALPEELQQHLRAVFSPQDARGAVPLPLLDLHWQRCASCGLVHARVACPVCRPDALTRPLAPGVPGSAFGIGGAILDLLAGVPVIAGGVMTRPIVFLGAAARGATILAAVIDPTTPDHHLRYAAYDPGDAGAPGHLVREDGVLVGQFAPDPTMQLLIAGEDTLVAKGGRVARLRPGQPPDMIQAEVIGGGVAPGSPTAIATNGGPLRYWIESGRLQRDAGDPAHGHAALFAGGATLLGTVVAGLTRFWVGPSFGLALTRAAGLQIASVFDALAQRSLNDSVALPPLGGHLLDASVTFNTATDAARARAWFFAAVRDGGRTLHRMTLLDAYGAILADATAEADDGSWLGALRVGPGGDLGACALGSSSLYVVTDGGIARVDAVPTPSRGGALHAAAIYPATEPYVVAGQTLLLPGQPATPTEVALYVVRYDGITELRFARS